MSTGLPQVPPSPGSLPPGAWASPDQLVRLEDIFTGTGVTLPPSAQRRQIVAELAELGSHDTSSDVQTSNEEELPSHSKTPRTIAAAVDMPDLDTITANAVKRAQQDLALNSRWTGWTVRQSMQFVSPGGETTLISHGEQGPAFVNHHPISGGSGSSGSGMMSQRRLVAHSGSTNGITPESEDELDGRDVDDYAALARRYTEVVTAEVHKDFNQLFSTMVKDLSVIRLAIEQCLARVDDTNHSNFDSETNATTTIGEGTQRAKLTPLAKKGKWERRVEEAEEEDNAAYSAVSSYDDLPDEILINHVLPKLGISDRRVFSCINRRTRALVERDAPDGGRLRLIDFVTCAARLRWALENGFPRNFSICEKAASGGYLELLQWARELDPPCPWNVWTCAEAAQAGQLDVLKWVRAQNPPCPWDWRTCASAARGGHLQVLRWVRGQNPHCPWDASTAAAARQGGHLELLQWAQEHGCGFEDSEDHFEDHSEYQEDEEEEEGGDYKPSADYDYSEDQKEEEEDDDDGCDY